MRQNLALRGVRLAIFRKDAVLPGGKLSKLFICKPLILVIYSLISRFDVQGSNLSFAPETRKKPNYAAHSHTSRSRLQNERRHAEKQSKELCSPRQNTKKVRIECARIV